MKGGSFLIPHIIERGKIMKQGNEKEYYDEVKDWDFSMFQIETENFTNWDLYEILKTVVTKESKVLDLGTGGGEKVIERFPDCAEILATDFSEAMIETANKNLEKSGRKNITFRIMDNLKMDVPENYFDVVIARNTVTDPVQIFKCLKPGGWLIMHGVDKLDCWELKRICGRGQAYKDKVHLSQMDYEAVLDAGFKNVELVPIHQREYFKNEVLFKAFLKKVPIIDDFSELDEKPKHVYKELVDEKLIDKYIKENTYDGKIRLIRRYYGITAKKES